MVDKKKKKKKKNRATWMYTEIYVAEKSHISL